MFVANTQSYDFSLFGSYNCFRKTSRFSSSVFVLFLFIVNSLYIATLDPFLSGYRIS